MMSCNPLNIPIEKMSDEEGSLRFILVRNNLLDLPNHILSIFNVQVGKSPFALIRDEDLNLVFIHRFSESKIREASINLGGLRVDQQVYIDLEWSVEQTHLYIADLLDPNNLKHSKASETTGRMFSEPGTTIPVTGRLISVGFSKISIAKVDLSEAKGLWNMQLVIVQNMIEGLKSCKEQMCAVRNSLFELAVVKQCIVMLVKAFEVYSRARFREMEKEGKSPDIDALRLKFAKSDYRKRKLNEHITATGDNIFASLFEIPTRSGRGFISFLNYRDCKAAYNKGYGIKFGELAGIGRILDSVQKYIELRNRIIHSESEQVIVRSQLSYANFPDIAFVEQAVYEFSYFVDALHAATL